MPYAIATVAFAAWFASSRYLFRRWVRTDAFTTQDGKCSHGYSQLHAGESCHKCHPLPKGQVAALAMFAGLFVPVVLVVAGLMHNAPLGRYELAQKTADLEEENARLRRMVRDT